MLRAGMMAAGEMDIDRLIDRDALLAPCGDCLGVPLGVGGGEPAAAIAGAGDEARANRAGADREPDCLDCRGYCVDFIVGHAREQKVLPDREPDIAVAEFTG